MEKPTGDGAYINGGFRSVAKGNQSHQRRCYYWERQPLEELARSGQLEAFKHDGFWQPMDTLRDKQHLEELWNLGKAPWKVWE
jgi:glucose-1-phosphate cytidylyltransferase